MAAPTITSVTTTENTGAGTNHSITVPTTANGDLLLLFFATDGAETITWPSGYQTGLGTDPGQLNTNATVEYRYRICDGTETSPITITTGTNERASCIIARILADEWHGTTPPEQSSSSAANAATHDPPNLSASWGAEDNLFICISAGDNVGSRTFTSHSSGYTDNQTATTGQNGSGRLSLASKGTTADQADDPGVITWSGTQWMVGTTVVVRPAAAGGGGLDIPIAYQYLVYKPVLILLLNFLIG